MTKSTPECDRFAHEFVAGVAAGYPEPQRRQMLAEHGIGTEPAGPLALEFVAGVAGGYPEPQRREMLSELGIAIETAEPAEAEPSPIALSMGGRY